jgi:FAD/FMN-containing dehydrogenase
MTETKVTAEPELNPSFQGEVIAPTHRDYDDTRAIYNASIDRRPEVILRPHGAADVIDAIAYARETKLPVSVRCGGHGIAGTSLCEGGILIDLAALKGVHVDPARGTALAQGGALWGEYDRETELFGVLTPGGRVTTTGVGGFTLGGGYGWLSPVYGLTCDNLVGADVVTADGRLVHASEDENPELLWGLRGAGANFGVVTSYELRTHRVGPMLLAGMLVVPNDESIAGEVVREYHQYVEQAPEELCTGLGQVLAPPEPFVPPALVGSPIVGIFACYAGDPADGAAVMQPLRDLVGRVGGMDLVQEMPYTAFQAMIDGFNPKGWLNYHRGIHLSGLTDEVLDSWLAVGRTISSPMTQGVIFKHGGAIARVDENATAAGSRSAPYMAHPVACWATPEQTDQQMDWVRRYTEAVAPVATGGTYLNFEPAAAGAGDLKAAFGDEKLRRLVALKDEWDPENLFRSNHNIRPSGWKEEASHPAG